MSNAQKKNKHQSTKSNKKTGRAGPRANSPKRMQHGSGKSLVKRGVRKRK